MLLGFKARQYRMVDSPLEDAGMPSKWDGLDGPGFRFEDLGRPAVFLIPVSKLQKRIGGKSAAEDLDHFLTQNFGAFTRMTIVNFGVWVDGPKTIVYDKCSLY